MSAQKSTLAKLLAKENITVQYGNYQTAWFDIKDRVLGLPQWKDMGKDVTDLLIGHEVGHALFTPFEGWHDSPEKLEGCPRSYINVIEDARIERHIKDRYAGLVAPMARGYKKLFDEEFFGPLDDLDWDEVKLIDKINLKAKIGAHIDVPFTDEEVVYYDRAMKTTTFEEVTELCRDILAYTKENQEDLLTPPEAPAPGEDNQQDNMEDPTESMGHDDMESIEGEDNESGSQPNRNTEAEESSSEASDRSSTESNESTNESEEDRDDGKSVKNEDEDVSLTDENFRRNEHTLLDRDKHGQQSQVCNEFNKEVSKHIVIKYADLKKARAQTTGWNGYLENGYYKEEFAKYIKEVKRNVNYAVKEFEMKKAAYRYTRAQTAKTGSIDVNRLWSYKTNDDIFSRVTKLADAKNHGMMMLIDYSGSMGNTISQVMDQLLHLVLFCKAVNIPYDVYGFTSTNPNFGYDGWSERSEDAKAHSRESEMSHSGLSLPQIISSTLKKADFEEALYHIYMRKTLAINEWSWEEREILSKGEDYGSTPLNEALVKSHGLIKAFKRKHAIDKMNLVILSDGEANQIRVVKSHKVNYVPHDTWGRAIIHVDGRQVHADGKSGKATRALLNNLRKNYGVCTLGFFIADGSHNFWRKIEDATGSYIYGADERRPFNREYGKKKCVTFNNALGYDEFYIVKHGRGFSAEADDFEVADDASTGTIRSQFKKYSKSKKNNKTLLTNFGRAVAE